MAKLETGSYKTIDLIVVPAENSVSYF